ncbi:MAG TPA: hypothetical protein VF132_05750, partial [Rudaea sp.]
MRASGHSKSNRAARRRRYRLLRAVFLAIALICANVFSSPAMAAMQHAAQHATMHSCHDGAKAPQGDHRPACPCCDDACSCLHGTSAPLPRFAAIGAIAPASSAVGTDRARRAEERLAHAAHRLGDRAERLGARDRAG